MPPPAPEPEIVLVEPEPNAELLAQIAALQAQIEELRDAPDSDAGADSAAAEAIDALTARIAALQDASENAQEQFQAELAKRDRELQQLRMDLDLARLEANKPAPAPLGPTDEELRAREEERLRREEEARRLAELQRRAEEERAFQERRISSPVIAFGGTGGANAGETELTERTFGEVNGYDELVLVSDIQLHSHCEHHMVPFVGKAHVAYIPGGRVVGLSKLARVVDVYAKRLQVQEKLTAQVADTINEVLQPQGVAVIIQCQHFCMCYRGVRKPGSWTTTSKLHGVFLRDAAARMELFTLIGMRPEIG